MVTLQQRFVHDVVHHFNDDHYILQMGGTELTLHCSGQAEQRRPLAPGVYEITLNYPCSLQGNNWTLSSIFHRTYNATPEKKVSEF